MSKRGVGFVVEGIEKLQAAFARMGVNFDFELGRALYLEGEHIMGRSKAIVPVDKGPLRASGHVQPPQRDKGGPLIVLGFGGPAVDYAVVQHERLRYQHTVGQQAKYLEQPALERAAVMDQAVADRLRRRLKKIVAA